MNDKFLSVMKLLYLAMFFFVSLAYDMSNKIEWPDYVFWLIGAYIALLIGRDVWSSRDDNKETPK